MHHKEEDELPLTQNDVKWEPFIEFWMRKSMLELKVKRMIWSQPGTVKTNGGRQELKRTSAGVYYRMRNNGNLVQYNRGEFNANLYEFSVWRFILQTCGCKRQTC